jgi:hypothetical protein
MGSVYANIVQKIQESNGLYYPKASYPRIVDFEEADPYYFVIRKDGKILSEGELPSMKLKLPDEYFLVPIKKIVRDPITLICTVDL